MAAKPQSGFSYCALMRARPAGPGQSSVFHLGVPQMAHQLSHRPLPSGRSPAKHLTGQRRSPLLDRCRGGSQHLQRVAGSQQRQQLPLVALGSATGSAAMMRSSIWPLGPGFQVRRLAAGCPACRAGSRPLPHRHHPGPGDPASQYAGGGDTPPLMPPRVGSGKRTGSPPFSPFRRHAFMSCQMHYPSATGSRRDGAPDCLSR